MRRRPTSGARTSRLLALALGAVTLATVTLAGPRADAQTSETAADVSFTVLDLTGILSPGGELEVRARVANEGPRTGTGLRVVGTLHSAVASRFAFQMAVDEGRLGTVVEGFSAAIDSLDAGHSTVVEFSHSATELGLRRADQFGVYPLRLQLLDDSAVAHEVRTALVFTAEEVEEPVRTTLMVPISAPPLLRADGSYDRAALISELGRAGRVQGLLGGLAAREGFAATVAPDALLLDELADLAGGFTLSDGGQDAQAVGPEHHLATQARRLLERTDAVAARSDVDVLAMPYGRADLGALVAGDMDAEAARHVEEAWRILEQTAGTALLRGALWPPNALNTATLGVLADADVDTVVLSERHLAILQDRDLTPSPVRTLTRTRTRDEVPSVLVPDPWLEDVLERETAPDGVAVAVQRVLAETAAVYFERPFAVEVRGLLLAPPQSWSPERGLAGGLMDALDAAPWLRPVTLSQLGRSVEAESVPVRLDYDDAARTRELSPTYVAALADARRSLGSLAGVLATDDDTPSRFDRLLLAAASVHFRTAPAEGRAMIRTVADTVTDLYSAVSIEDGPQVWMDAEGPVPVTITNDAAVPLRVRVLLQSQRFIFADEPIGQPPDDRGGWVIPPESSVTLSFQASAVTPGGRAPVSVVVTDVDGVLVLAEDTIVIRSTAVSVAALIVTGAAGLFLLVWIVRQVARRRRGSRQDPAAEPAVRSAAQAGGPKRR